MKGFLLLMAVSAAVMAAGFRALEREPVVVGYIHNHQGDFSVVEASGKYYVSSNFHPGTGGELIEGSIPPECVVRSRDVRSVYISKYSGSGLYQVQCDSPMEARR